MRAHLAVLASIGLTAGCQLERLFPEEVGAGAARLTILSAANAIDLVDRNTDCGFASADVNADVEIEGAPGQTGTAVWRVRDCTIALSGTTEDCDGNETHAMGTIKVSGTRTVTGYLTGDPATPVIPETPDAVRIVLDLDATRFHITRAPDEPHMNLLHGALHVEAGIHLAVSESLGVCAVPTNDVTLRAITLKNAAMHIDDAAGRAFDVDVPQAELSAQIGKWDGRENALAGSITVWDSPVTLPAGMVFDDDYDGAKFRDSYACAEDLALPISYECPSVKPQLAQGVAQLTINNTGNVVSAFAKDAACGFESAGVKAAAVVTGDVGTAGGSVTYTIDASAPCVLDFGDAGRVTATTCTGDETRVYGRAALVGTLTIRGRVTGNPDQPIIPGALDAVTLDVHVTMDGVRVDAATTSESLEVVHGEVSAVMKPRMAIDDRLGACAIDTPATVFNDVAWAPGAQMVVRTGDNAIGATVDGSSLFAVNGPVGAEENTLRGELTLDGERFTIDGALDPHYERAAFQAELACIPHLVEATGDEDCSMRQQIADGVARLVIQTVGTVAGAVNMDAECGFSNTMDVLKNPTRVVGAAGERGELEWAISGCAMGPAVAASGSGGSGGGSDDDDDDDDDDDAPADPPADPPTDAPVDPAAAIYETDCAGATTMWSGAATVSSRRVIRGMREDIEVFLLGAVADSIAPDEPQSIDLWLEDVALTEFATWAIPAGGGEPLGVLTIHHGTLSAFVQPVTGWSDEQQRYTVPTPVATISDVHLRDARATLVSEGMRFEIVIDDVDLSATNGAVGATENEIAGTVTIDGETISIGGALDPEYDPARIAASWACNKAPEVGACAQSSPPLLSLWIAFAVLLRRTRSARMAAGH